MAWWLQFTIPDLDDLVWGPLGWTVAPGMRKVLAGPMRPGTSLSTLLLWAEQEGGCHVNCHTKKVLVTTLGDSRSNSAE